MVLHFYLIKFLNWEMQLKKHKYKRESQFNQILQHQFLHLQEETKKQNLCNKWLQNQSINKFNRCKSKDRSMLKKEEIMGYPLLLADLMLCICVKIWKRSSLKNLFVILNGNTGYRWSFSILFRHLLGLM